MKKISMKDARALGLSRRSFVQGAAAGAGALALAGCSSSSDSSGSSDDTASEDEEEVEVEADLDATVTFAITTAWESFNPYICSTSYSYLVADKIFDRPCYVNDDYVSEPRAASSWEVADDGVTLTFHLAEDATFHDGEPVTAEDWIFTLECLCSSEITAVSRSFTRFIEGCNVGGTENSEGSMQVEATDDYTVTVTLAEAYNLDTFMSCYASSFYILPAHCFEGMTPAEVWADSDFWAAPIGSGPFVYEEDVSGNSVTLSSFADYHLGAPQFAQLVFKVVSKSNFANSVMAGEVDLTFSHIMYDDAMAVEGEEGVQIEQSPHPLDTYLLGYNHNIVSQNMRKAVNYAIDKATMISQFFSPDCCQTETMVLADSDQYVDHTFERDLDTAAEYLQAAIDAGEWSEDSVFYIGSASDMGQNMGALIVQNLAEAGITAEFTAYDSSTMWSYLYDGTIHAAIFGLTPSGSILGLRMYYESMYADYLWFHMAITDFDEVIAKLETAASDDEILEYAAEFQDLEAEYIPFSMLAAEYPYSIKSSRMSNTDEFASYYLNNNPWEWVVSA